MKPWEYPVPPILYKFLPPDRFHILTDCSVRFTQRTCFPDDHELQPNVEGFGTEEEIKQSKLIEMYWPQDLLQKADITADQLRQLVANNPVWQRLALETALNSKKSQDQFGLFCMTDVWNNERMWDEYAAGGTGFVVGFDTTCFAFGSLKAPGKLGKVRYSDGPMGTFLSLIVDGTAPETFFRKRMQFAYEREWRSIRHLDRLKCHGDVFLSQFDPNCVSEIIVRARSPLENMFHHFLAIDCRYRRVRLKVLP